MNEFNGLPMGMRLIESDEVPEFKTIEVPPSSRFIEYEESDKVWLRYFGMMRQVVTKDRVLFKIFGCIYAHPVTVQKLRMTIGDLNP